MIKRFVAFLLALLLLASTAVAASGSIKINGKRIDEGLYAFSDGKKSGYMDINGKVAIKAQFISAQPFSNGLAAVQYSNKGFARSKYIDAKGKTIIKNIDTSKRMYMYEPWQGDYGVVEVWSVKNGSITPIAYNYINKKAKLIYPGEDLVYVSDFSEEGYACVGAGSSYQKLTRTSADDGKVHYLAAYSGNTPTIPATSYFFIDKNGKTLGDTTWALAQPFSEGLAGVAISGADGNPVWGFVDTTGALAIAPQWDSVGSFHNGVAIVTKDEKRGLIDKSGNTVLPCGDWDNMITGSDNGMIAVKSGDKWGYVDAKGNVVIEPAFDSAGGFFNGQAIVYDGFSYGAINEQGDYVIYPAYQTLSRLGDLYAASEFPTPVIVNEKGEVVALLLVGGALPTETQLQAYPEGTACKLVELAGVLDNGLTLRYFESETGEKLSMNILSKVPGTEFHIASGSGKMLMLDNTGAKISDKKWESIQLAYSTPNCICVVQNNLYGYVDPQGETLIVPQFSEVNAFANGYAMTFTGSKLTVVDENGLVVIPPINSKSSKDEIKRLQQALIDQGFSSAKKADGKFGKNTTKAIQAAQEAFGLEVTGTADYLLQNKLFQ